MSSLWRRLFTYKEFKICLVGLDNAGKTTILFQLSDASTVEARSRIAGLRSDGLSSHTSRTIACALSLSLRSHMGEVVETQPTIGSNVESVKHNNVHFVSRTAANSRTLDAARATLRFVRPDSVALPPVLACSSSQSVWDLGGQESLRQSWQTYYLGTHAVIIVVDSTDRGRIDLVKMELDKLLQNAVRQLA